MGKKTEKKENPNSKSSYVFFLQKKLHHTIGWTEMDLLAFEPRMNFNEL